MSQLNGSMPTVFELAEELSMTQEEVKDLMCKARQPISLEIKIGENHDTALVDMLEDEDQTPEVNLEISCIKEDIRNEISQLPRLQAEVISMRYGIGEEILEPLSMTAIGQVLNMSRDRVRT